MKIAVFGIGGVGGILGGALARENPDTFFCARGRNLEAIRQDGLRVQSPMLGDFAVRPRLASDNAADFGVVDAVIVSCKGCSLPESCGAIAPMLAPHTVVVPLFNGLMLSELMAPLLPPCVLADGVVYIFSHLEGPGRVAQTSKSCRVIAGMRDGSRPDALEELAGILNRAGIQASVTDDILTESWRKYVTMGSSSVMFCYYDGPAGKVREDPDYETVLRAVVGEMIAVAAARGVRLPEDMGDRLADLFREMPPENMTSLYRDLSGGKAAKETELHNIIGRMVEMGREAGIPTPYHSAAYERFASR